MNDRAFRPKNVLWRWDGMNKDIIVVMSPETYKIHILNPVASKIFYLCNGKRSISDILIEISSQFLSTDADIEGDVTTFILELYKKGLINLKGGENK